MNPINNGSPAHVRYGHYYYPKRLLLRCPKCHAKAIATNPQVPKEVVYFMDIADVQKSWTIVCSSCTFRLGADWDTLRAMDLYLKVPIRGLDVWAWNTNHLAMILKRLRKQDIQTDPWAAFATYIPKKWLSKLNNSSAFRKIEQLLQQNS